jgi:YkoY family integral membrane protein
MFGEDLSTAIFIILDLILIESLLSVDNAAVLATMVMDLPKKLRNKALQYGIIGAYVFRGICLFFASYMAKILWLKALGGFYLIYITYNHFKKYFVEEKSEVEEMVDKRENWLYKITSGTLGIFWSTVVLVEVMDLAFSIDNIFAAVAITENIFLICIGVFIGILAMRFVAQSFVQLMETYPFLENTAFIVIGILGLKLVVSSGVDYFASDNVREVVNGHQTDLIFSLITAAFFFVPLLTSYFFNFPQKSVSTNND